MKSKLFLFSSPLGGAVEPFWQLYAVHKANPEVLLMLEEYRIGNLAQEERVEKAKEEAELKASDPYLNVSYLYITDLATS